MNEPLADAQITKLVRIAAKLRLQLHDKILDISCGWGGLAFALASAEPGESVTSITLSENQHDCAKTGVEPTPQAKHIHYEFRDYRHQTGQFDKIVSVGMLKHRRHPFFANIAMVRRHYDARFIRMWEFYLTGCECFFRSQAGMVLQLQLGHDCTATPLGRR